MNSSVEKIFFLNEVRFISEKIITNIFVITGIVLNIVTFCIWVFGPKSKIVCCAVYFAANAFADVLLLTVRDEEFWLDYIEKTDVTCILIPFLNRASFQLSTWISAIITVERSLTIMCPFVFKSHTMRRRSKYVILVIVLLQPLSQYASLYFMKKGIGNEGDLNNPYCYPYNEELYEFDKFLGETCLTYLLPFIVVVVFNAATVFTLCRSRMRRITVSGSRDYVNVFTKLTLMTGVSFIIAFALTVFFTIDMRTRVDLIDMYLMVIYFVGRSMRYFNSCMNPIICFSVCKSLREDIKHFLSLVARKCQCACKGPQIEAARMNVDPDNIALNDVLPVNADTRLNVLSTPV